MKEKPILFRGEMVRAILDGRKTQTRRIVRPRLIPVVDECFKVNGKWCNYTFGYDLVELSPYGPPGGRLWVRETHYYDTFEKFPKSKPANFPMDFYYRADGECCEQIPECQCFDVGKTPWRPSIFLPRWASRITLEITKVRVERLQDISETDAIAEGCEMDGQFPKEQEDPSGIGHRGWDSAIEWYSDLWENINGEGSWDDNPWVWVTEFKQIK